VCRCSSRRASGYRLSTSSSGPAPRSAPRARALLDRQLTLWEQPASRVEALARMRSSNAEWDFMGRTFLVLALANAALREPAETPRHLAVIDRIVDETLERERERGMLHFLMPYATLCSFIYITLPHRICEPCASRRATAPLREKT
jgi:hypothetical protein